MRIGSTPNYISYAANITDWYYTNWYDFGYAGHKKTNRAPARHGSLWGRSNDWWMWWKGANYEKGWDVLNQDTIMPYKDVGCDGPTLYRHAEGTNFAFYDGHMEHMKKDKVWNIDDWGGGRPGMSSPRSTTGLPPPTSKDTCRTPKRPVSFRKVLLRLTCRVAQVPRRMLHDNRLFALCLYRHVLLRCCPDFGELSRAVACLVLAPSGAQEEEAVQGRISVPCYGRASGAFVRRVPATRSPEAVHRRKKEKPPAIGGTLRVPTRRPSRATVSHPE